jgi:hypothetical protein
MTTVGSSIGEFFTGVDQKHGFTSYYLKYFFVIIP